MALRSLACAWLSKAGTAAAALCFAATMSEDALAVADKDLARCAAISGSLDRLECFDRLMEKEGLDRPQALPVDTNDTGKWRVSRDRNPIDDTERVTLALRADSGKARWGDPIVAVARCQSNKTEFYINWHDYLGDDSSSVYADWKYVTIRIGDQSAERQKWGVSTDNEATFAPDWAGELLKRMTKADRLIVQTTPYNENPLTAIFDTTGLSNALAPLMDACNWSLN